MCGRNTIFSDKNKIKKELRADIWKNEEDFNPTYNLSPTQNSPVLIKTTKEQFIQCAGGLDLNQV